MPLALATPQLRDGQVVFLPPGTFGSCAMAQTVSAPGSQARVSWAETGTPPYLARNHDPREVNVTIRAIHLPTGVYLARRRVEALCLAGPTKGESQRGLHDGR